MSQNNNFDNVNVAKVNDISFFVSMLNKSVPYTGLAQTFRIVYMAYLIKKAEAANSVDLEKYINQTLEDKRKFFLSQSLAGESAIAFNVAATYTEEELLAYLYYCPRNDGRFDGEYSTPESICKLAIKILSIEDSDKVADLGSGIGDFLLRAYKENQEASFWGIDLNTQTEEVSEIRAELFSNRMKIKLGNMFDLPDTEKYDKIFSNYPFGMKLIHLQEGIKLLDELHNKVPEIKKATSSDWIYNALLLNHLDENGKAVAVMTNGSTWNSIDLKIREYFVRGGFIEAIIALPPRMFSMTAIPTTMIVLSRNNKSVRMVDATSICVQGRRQNEFSEEDIKKILDCMENDTPESRTVTIDELSHNEFVLNPSRFLEKEVEIQDGVEFGSLMKRITRGAPLKASDLDEMVSDVVTDTQYLMLANIQNGIISDDLPYLKELDSRYDKYCIVDRNLLLSKNGAPFKVAVAEVEEGRKILGNGNLFIIELDEEKVNPYFLKAFFDSEVGTLALQRISVGAAMPNISAESLKRMLVPLPSMEKQNEIAEKYQSKVDEIKVLNLKLQRAKNELKAIFEEE